MHFKLNTLSFPKLSMKLQVITACFTNHIKSNWNAIKYLQIRLMPNARENIIQSKQHLDYLSYEFVL